jgi:hypothetical protein
MEVITIKKGMDKHKVRALLQFLKSWDIEAEATPNVSANAQSNYVPFSESRGMWKNRDIDARKLRCEAWGGCFPKNVQDETV